MSNTLENHYTFNSMEFFFAFKNLANMGLIKLKYLNNQVKISLECDLREFLGIMLASSIGLEEVI